MVALSGGRYGGAVSAEDDEEDEYWPVSFASKENLPSILLHSRSLTLLLSSGARGLSQAVAQEAVRKAVQSAHW